MSAETEILRRIYLGTCQIDPRSGLKPASHAMITAAAKGWDHRPEVIAGILMRESRGGEALDSFGLGDGGHGHGLMQIDDRYWTRFCSGEAWKKPEDNVDFGARVLSGKKAYLGLRIELPPDELERASIAAYNCGEGRVLESLQQGEDVDFHTTGQDYSTDVLRLAEMYLEVMAEMEPEPAAETEPIPARKPGWGDAVLAAIHRISKVFTPRA